MFCPLELKFLLLRSWFSWQLKIKMTGCYILQLFGLVNTLLENSRQTAERDLSIQRYAVIPLSPNSGLIGWVANCDTLHHLIREYRDAKKVCCTWLPQDFESKLCFSFCFCGRESSNDDHSTLYSLQINLNQEHKFIISFAPIFDHLPVMGKVEAFQYALQNTEGNDLAKVLFSTQDLHVSALWCCYCSITSNMLLKVIIK